MDIELKSPDGSLHRLKFESNRDAFTLDIEDGGSATGSWLRAGAHTVSLLTEDGQSHLVHLARDESGQIHLQYDGRAYRLTDPADEEDSTSGGGTSDTGGDINEQGEVLSPMPGKVVGLPVAVGDRVAPGDLLVILESMKMENPVLSPVAGVVKRLPLAVGDPAALGDPLIQLELDDESE